jgi:hypothetical protein
MIVSWRLPSENFSESLQAMHPGRIRFTRKSYGRGSASESISMHRRPVPSAARVFDPTNQTASKLDAPVRRTSIVAMLRVGTLETTHGHKTDDSSAWGINS